MSDPSRLAQLQEWKDTLEAARNSGAIHVQWGDGTRVQYRSDAELVKALATIDRRMAAGGGGPRPSRIYFSTSKGL